MLTLTDLKDKSAADSITRDEESAHANDFYC